MAEIKSSIELAMEKAEKLGKASEEELIKWKYLPEGKRLAVDYLKGKCNLMAELAKYHDIAKDHIAKGAQEVFLREIGLPQDNEAKSKNKKAMEGIGLLKKDKVALENVYTKMRRIFKYYEEEGGDQRKQAYEMFKRDFQSKFQQAVQKMGISMRVAIDVEKHPQFQEEWRKVKTQLDSQYHNAINECKQEIMNIP
ncbi:MAG TPA: hypothetical protein EYP21_10280 [Syntrophaceae bacterium]|nr:hypothetical protein [Syntrophaceae bacterium]